LLSLFAFRRILFALAVLLLVYLTGFSSWIHGTFVCSGQRKRSVAKDGRVSCGQNIWEIKTLWLQAALKFGLWAILYRYRVRIANWKEVSGSTVAWQRIPSGCTKQLSSLLSSPRNIRRWDCIPSPNVHDMYKFNDYYNNWSLLIQPEPDGIESRVVIF
jgi:hypothetical protein